MSFSDWSNKKKGIKEEKKEERGSSASAAVNDSGAGRKTFTDWSNQKQATSSLEGWGRSASSLLEETRNYFQTWRKRDEDSGYNALENRRSSLLAQADGWRKQYAGNEEAVSYINSVVEALSGVSGTAKSYFDFYDQFESGDAYNTWKTREDFIEAYLEDPEQAASTMDHEADWLEEANRRAQIKQIKDAADFGDYSRYTSTKTDDLWEKLWSQYSMGYNDLTYEYINNQGGIRREISGKQMAYGADTHKESSFARYDYMNDDEVSVYNYYYAKDGRERAEEYLDSIEATLEARANQETVERVSEFAGEHPVFASALSVGTSLGSGFEYIGDVVQYGADKLTGKDAYMGTNEMALMTNAVRGTVSDQVDWQIGNWDAFDFLYSTAMSGADSLAAGLVFGKAGGAVLGLSAAAQGTNDALARGMSDGQTFWNGLFSGVFEGLFETVSIGNFNKLKEIAPESIKDIFKNLAKSMLVNASEESLTELANIGYDTLVNGEFANYTWEELKAGAWKDALLQVLEAGASGALMGIGMGGVGNSIGYFNGNQNVKAQYGEFQQELVNEGLEIAPENAFAQKMQGRLDDGKDLRGGQLRKLVAQNEKAITGQDIASIQSAAAQRLTELGETGDVEAIAAALAKRFSGQELTRKESALIEDSQYGRRVSSEMNPENIRSGGYSSDWAERIGTQSIHAEEYGRLLQAAESQQETAETAGGKIAPEGLKAVQAGKAELAGASAANGQQVTGKLTGKEAVQAAGDGVTRQASTGKEVNPQKIVSIEGGRVMIQTDSGTIPADDIEFGSSDADLLWRSAARFNGITAAGANGIIRAYRSGDSVTDYIQGAAQEFRNGYHNMESGGVYADKLNPAQREIIYELGQKASGENTARAQAKATAAKKATGAKNATVGTVHFDRKGRTFDDVRETALKTMEQLSRVLGVEFHVFESYRNAAGELVYRDAQGNEVSAPNGYYDFRDGSIHIDLNAGADGKGTMLFTIAHELTHFIKEWSPAKFKVLANELMKQYAEQGISVNALVENQMQKAEKNGRELSWEDAYEEVVADSMEAILTDGNVVQLMAAVKEQDKSLWQKIRDWFRDLAADLKAVVEAYKDHKPDSWEGKMVAQMEDVIPLLEYFYTKALADASENYQAAKAEKNTTREGGVKMQTRMVNGNQVVWIEGNILKENKGKPEHQFIANYIAEHIGEVYTIIESGQKVYIGEDLPGEYTQSKYTKAILKRNPSISKAKNRASANLGEMIEIATNRRWEKTKHTSSKDAKYGMYRYDTQFGFPVKNAKGDVVGANIYDAELLIRNASDGKKYLYDIVSIKKNIANSDWLTQRVTSAAGKPAGQKGDVSTHNVAQDADVVKEKFSLREDSTYAEIEEERRKLYQREMQLRQRKQKAENDPELLRAMDEVADMFIEMRSLLPKRRNRTATEAELDRIEELKKLRDERLQQVAKLQESLGLSAIAQEEAEIRETKETLRVASDAAWAREGAEKENRVIEKAGVSAAEYFRKKALKVFKTTTNFNEAGYLLPDGKLLNFSGGERNHRYRDHREIGEIYEATQGAAALNRFLNDGNIRIMAESPGADIAAGVEPTKEQYAALRRFINDNGVKDGKFFVDFSDAEGHRAGSYSYEGRVYADRVINDIKHYYATGEIREQSSVSQFRYSDRDSDGNDLSREQREYFQDSKVRDEQGRLMVMYHGTPNGSHTKFRSGTYFTPNRDYADKYQNPNASMLSTKKNADDPKTYEVYLNITKPFDTRNPRERRIFMEEYYRQWGTGAPLADSGLPDWTDGMDLQEFIEEMEYDYDGLILDEGATGGYGLEVKSRGLSYVTFSSEQVKNVDNRTPTNDPDIRYSDRDADGMELSEEQRAFFAQSKVRDADGNLLVMYHGSSSKDKFTVFERRPMVNGKNYGDGYYFTEEKAEARKWGSGKLYKVYVNLTNPYYVSDRGDVPEAVAAAARENYGRSYDRLSQNPGWWGSKLTREAYIEKNSRMWRNPDIALISAVDTTGIPDGSEASYHAEIARRKTEMLRSLGYDGVVVAANRDNRNFREVMAFDSGQIKLTTNRNPRSADDIRYSERDPELEKVNRVLAKENAELKHDIGYLKELLNLQKKVTGGTKFTRPSVEAAAGQLMKYANAKGDKAELAKILNSLYEGIANTEKLTWDGVNEAARSAVEWLRTHVKTEKRLDSYAQDILRQMRGSRIYLDEKQKQEAAYAFGTFHAFRQKTMGSVIVTDKNATSLDSQWNEWASLYPDIFAPDTNSNDMPSALLEAIATLRNMKEDVYGYDEELFAQDLLRQVYDSYWNVSTLYTVADQFQQKINQLKQNHAQRMAALRKYHNEQTAKLKQEHREDLARVRQAERDRTEKKLTELSERYRESRERGAENRRKTEMRRKIRRTILDLKKLLNKGDKKRNVKEDMKDLVSLALKSADILFTDNYSNEDMVRDGVGTELTEQEAKYMAEAREIMAEIDNLPSGSYEAFQARQETEAKLRSKLDYRLSKLKDVFIRERARLNKAKVSEVLGNLADAYASLENSEQNYVSGAFEENVHQYLLWLKDEVGGTTVKDMSLGQMEELHKAYTMVLTTVRNANKMFAANLQQTREQLGSQTIAEVQKAGGEHGLWRPGEDKVNAFSWNNQKPVYAFERIGSETLATLFRNTRAGEDTWAQDMTDAREFYLAQSKKHKYDSWNFDKQYKFTSTSGIDFSLNLEQIMSLYAYSKREQAHDHLLKGGFVFDGNTEVQVNRMGIKMTYLNKTAKAHNVSPELLGQIVGKLTAEQKEFVDEMQDYLSTTMGAKGNEVSMKMYGVELFKEKYYFPLRSAGQYLARAKEADLKKEQGQISIVNSGFTKATTPKSSNPVVLSGFLDVWASHVNEMSMYHSFVLPMEDFRRVYNYASPNMETGQSISVNSVIQNAYGKEATDYIDQLYRDLNGGAVSDPRDTLIKSLTGKFKKAAVFSSLSVVIQQPSAIGRAFALVDPKYFIGGKVDGKRHKALWAQLKQYAPVATIKEMGYFDTGMGMSAQDFLKGREYRTLREKAAAVFTDGNYRDELLSKGPALADELTWCAIWEAVKRETKARNRGLSVSSEEFLAKAGARFTEVIVKTQVYDSVLSRSANMRAKGLMTMWTSFMAEPTTTINMVEDALRKGKRGDKKYAARTMGAVLSSVILNSALVSLVYAMRDDDEDETFLEKYTQSFATEILDGINPLTYYPFLKDIWSAAQGFDIERSDMSLITSLTEAVTKLVQVYNKKTDNMDEEQQEAHGKSLADAWWGVVDYATALAGVPVKNVRRDVNAVRNVIKTIGQDLDSRDTSWGSLLDKTWESMKNSIPIVGWLPDETAADKLYKATISGDTAYRKRLASSYATESALNSAIRKGLRANDSRIWEAAMAWNANDLDAYKRIAREIIGEGHFSQDNVVMAIRAEADALAPDDGTAAAGKAKGLFTAEKFAVAISQGNDTMAAVIKADIIETAQRNGKTQEEAEKSFSSSAKSNLKELFFSGDIHGDRAVQVLTAYCGYEQEDAEDTVGAWQFEADYPELDGKITYTQYKRWETDGKPNGIDLDTFTDVAEYRDDGTSDSVKSQDDVAAYINSLPISTAQKDALWCCFWKESTLKNAPWH